MLEIQIVWSEMDDADTICIYSTVLRATDRLAATQQFLAGERGIVQRVNEYDANEENAPLPEESLEENILSIDVLPA